MSEITTISDCIVRNSAPLVTSSDNKHIIKQKQEFIYSTQVGIEKQRKLTPLPRAPELTVKQSTPCLPAGLRVCLLKNGTGKGVRSHLEKLRYVQKCRQ